MALVFLIRSFEEKFVDLLLIGDENKKHYIPVKEFNTFMHNHMIHYIVEENTFVITLDKLLVQKEILKCYAMDCFKINGKKLINIC